MREAAPLVLAAAFNKEEAVGADRVQGVNCVDVVRGQRAVSLASSFPGQVEAAAEL